MAPLGEHFPAELLRPRIEAALKPGCVIRLLVKFPHVTKQKFLVLVADDDPVYLTFVVNSEINPFISNRPHLLQCQVLIDVANHKFLDHDSHIACNEVLPMKREEVIKSLIELPATIFKQRGRHHHAFGVRLQALGEFEQGRGHAQHRLANVFR